MKPSRQNLDNKQKSYSSGEGKNEQGRVPSHPTILNLIVSGQLALQTADWSGAKTSFEEALREAASPEAHDGLGIALWWLNDIRASHEQRMLAYNGFKGRGEAGRAAMIAGWLAREQVFLYGNVTAMNGWFARADRLLEQIPPGLESTWCQMLRVSLTEPANELVDTASQIMEQARKFSDGNLEAIAMAFCGQAKILLGQVKAGMADLDEAMTMTTGGEVTDFMIISEVFCVMLSACETASDLVRCEHWCQIASEFAERHQCPFLSAYCRTTYGSLMTATGRWQEAESALIDAIRAFEIGHRGLRVHAVIKLADLRVYQGRYEEAEVLLVGLEDQGAALVPLAHLHLAKGEAELAKAVLDQVLQSAQSYTLENFPALLLRVEVFLAMYDFDAARRTVADLMSLAPLAQSNLLTAQVALANGQVSLYTGQITEALDSFNAALIRLKTFEQSLIAGRVRLEMARTLQADDPFGAITWAKAAFATFERMGAARDSAAAVALLRQLGVPARTGPRSHQNLTNREEEILSFLALNLSNREIAERLVISPKTVEHHVSRILDKLNLRSRAEAAVFMLSGKLSERPE